MKRNELRRRWDSPPGAAIARDIRQAVLSGEEIQRMDLVRMLAPIADLRVVPSGLDFRGFGTDLQFRDLDLSDADFSGATLGPRFFRCLLDRANLSGAVIHQVAVSSGTSLKAVGVSAKFLGKCEFPQGDFSKCKLMGAMLSECRVAGSLFIDGNLARTSISECDLRGCDFQRADLSGSSLVNNQVDSDTDLRGANLNGVMSSEIVSRAGDVRVPGTDLSVARVDETTSFGADGGVGREIAAAIIAQARRVPAAVACRLPERISAYVEANAPHLDVGGHWLEAFRAELAIAEQPILDCLVEPALRRLV